MPDSANPTILVRKKDGTTVRMTMADFGKYQKEKQSPTKKSMHSVALSNNSSDEKLKSAQKKWSPEDHASLLDDDMAVLPAIATSHELTNAAPVKNIFYDEAKAAKTTSGGISQKLDWILGADKKRRAESLVESRINDVRNDDQFLAYAMTPEHRGGVGLSPDEANKLLVLAHDIIAGKEKKLKEKLPQTPSVSYLPLEDKIIKSEKNYFDVNNLKPISIQSNQGIKQPIQDIAPPAAKISVGPAEEFSSFSVSDFQHLAPTTPAATAKLKEKFEVFRQDSVIVFLDIRDAWYRSPLYRAYVDAVVSALASRKKVADILVSGRADKKESLTMEIFSAVIEINRHLGL